MINRLEYVATQIEREILETGRLVVNGVSYGPSSIIQGNHPLSGHCQNAAGRVIEEFPELDFEVMRAQMIDERKNHRGIHLVTILPGEYLIDPTIGQFEDSRNHVFDSSNPYPLHPVRKNHKIENGKEFYKKHFGEHSFL